MGSIMVIYSDFDLVYYKNSFLNTFNYRGNIENTEVSAPLRESATRRVVHLPSCPPHQPFIFHPVTLAFHFQQDIVTVWGVEK